jgi:hypothetical protein
MRDQSDRLEKQRVRQRNVRERNKKLRRPGRDDIARMLLHIALEENLRRGDLSELNRLQDGLTAALVRQGFDRQQSDRAFEELVDKYKSGWTFQRKVHLATRSDER